MERKQLINTILEIFNNHIQSYVTISVNGKKQKITEYTDLHDYPFDNFDKTMLVIKLENEFHVFFDDVNFFKENSRVCKIADVIESKLNGNGKPRRFDKIIKDIRTLAEAIYERNDKAGLYDETYINRTSKNIEEEIRDIVRWLSEETD